MYYSHLGPIRAGLVRKRHLEGHSKHSRMPVKTGACHLRNSDGLLRVVPTRPRALICLFTRYLTSYHGTNVNSPSCSFLLFSFSLFTYYTHEWVFCGFVCYHIAICVCGGRGDEQIKNAARHISPQMNTKHLLNVFELNLILYT